MPWKRVLPTVAANLRGDYAEGLGRCPTGFLLANKSEKEEV
jgi:hypothetical protein